MSLKPQLPIWQDERPVVGEDGVRDLRGPYVFNSDAMLDGRALRLLEARPAPASLSDDRLTLAIYACRGRDRANPAYRAWHNDLLAEREARQSGVELKAAA